MRTTLTLDDDVAKTLKRKLREGGADSFKDLVNRAIRDGLAVEDELRRRSRKTFVLKGRLLRSKGAFNFHKAQQLAEFAENDPDFRF